VIRLTGVRKSFGEVEVLAGVGFEVAPGEVVAVLGPSGCGKSTLLRVVAGFEGADAGRVEVLGAPVTGPGPDRGLVDQDSTLFPWLSLRDNLAWGPRMAGHDDPTAEADRLIAETGLAGFADALPAALSGGMRQRASIAQVLAVRPPVLLLDEPFGALDAQTRLRMHGWLRGLLRTDPAAALIVTHDVDEALLLADRLLVLSQRPARILLEEAVDLPDERGHRTLADPAFVALKDRLLRLLLEAA
jgi:NitT/TauT family transport system ATP-binding protein